MFIIIFWSQDHKKHGDEGVDWQEETSFSPVGTRGRVADDLMRFEESKRVNNHYRVSTHSACRRGASSGSAISHLRKPVSSTELVTSTAPEMLYLFGTSPKNIT